MVYLTLALCVGSLGYPQIHPRGVGPARGGRKPRRGPCAWLQSLKVRMLAIMFGGACAGLGGAYLSLIRVPQWTEGMTAGAGWIALAIVVFASGSRARFAGCLFFGGVTVLQLNLQAAGLAIPVEYLSMSPYLITIVVLVIMSAPRRAENPRILAAPPVWARIPRLAVEANYETKPGEIPLMKRRTILAGPLRPRIDHDALSHEDKTKVGFIYVGPVGDGGWTYEHNKGRLAVEADFGEKVETVFVESVPEGPGRRARHDPDGAVWRGPDLHNVIWLHGPDNQRRGQVPEREV